MSGVRVSQPVQEHYIMAGIVNYIQESFNELKNHVTWPPLSEAQRLMVVVAVFSVIFSLAVWGVDTAFSRVIKLYFEKVVRA